MTIYCQICKFYTKPTNSAGFESITKKGIKIGVCENEKSRNYGRITIDNEFCNEFVLNQNYHLLKDGNDKKLEKLNPEGEIHIRR